MQSPDFTAVTPDGVPVRSTSPGSIVTYFVKSSIKVGMSKIMASVRQRCFSSQFIRQNSSTSCGLAILLISMKEPTGHEVSNDFAKNQGVPVFFASSWKLNGID